MTAVCTLENGKIISVQKAKKDGDKSTKVIMSIFRLLNKLLFQSVREMNGADELVYTMSIDGSDIVCVQKFKRI